MERIYMERLTRLAEMRAHSRIASGFIVETEPGQVRALAADLSPIVETFQEIFPRILERPAPPIGAYPAKVIPRFNMLACILPREVVFQLENFRSVRRVYSDEMMWATQLPTVPDTGVFTAPHKITKEVTFTSTFWTKKLVGADVANSKGFNGRGINVAITDTGASRIHEQIRRVEFDTTTAQHRDENGHGTWCTSCIGGWKARDDYLSKRSGREVLCEGMAPECNLLAIKCLGWGVGCGSTSNIIEAVDLAISRGSDIISMSLGGTSETESPEDDPQYPVFENALEYGIIPVVAAGNSGPGENTVGSPGCLPQVLTIGAWDPVKGGMADFSSRGPTNWGDVKPDVICPGVNIDSAIVGVLDSAGDGVPSRYSPISGTSMATPHAAGLIALMRESFKKILGKTLTVEEIKLMMKELGTEKNNISGWGALTWSKWEQWLSTQYGVK